MKKMKVILLMITMAAALTFGGCGKDDETSESTAVEVTPTPTATPSSTPAPTATPTPAGEQTAPSTELTGTIISASMNDLVLRTSDNKEYNCSTLNATKSLSGGVTIGATITVTLESVDSDNGVFKASRLSDNESSSQGSSEGSSDGYSEDSGSYSSSGSESDYDSGYDSDNNSGYDSGYDSDNDSGYDSSYDSDNNSGYDSSYDSDNY